MTVQLTSGRVAVVDKQDFSKVSSYKWHILAKRYAGTRINGKVTYLHRFITAAPQGAVVDHIDGDTLNNRRRNLRVVDQHINGINRTRRNKNNTSGVPGVCWNTAAGKWMAYIALPGQHKHLGLYRLKRDAVRARKAGEAKYRRGVA